MTDDRTASLPPMPATAPARGVRSDPWQELRAHTAARIALGRSGSSLPTQAVLAFDLAHAQARDAVLTPLDVTALQQQLQSDGWPVMHVHSRAATRAAYLARPDWGRRLQPESAAALQAQAGGGRCDLAFVVSDGLSSTAVQNHVAAFLRTVRPALTGLRLAPIVIASQARVALADEVGALLGARIAVSLIGERPGLSSPDSLGLYLTYAPQLGRNDGERNCISNIRPAGLDFATAAQQFAALLQAAQHSACSGVALRFDPARTLPGADAPHDAP